MGRASVSQLDPSDHQLSFFLSGGAWRAHRAALMLLLHLALAALAHLSGVLCHKGFGDFAAALAQHGNAPG